MTTDTFRQHVIPVSVMVIFGILLWYCLTIGMNASGAIARVLPKDGSWNYGDLVQATMSMTRPILPAPHQIIQDIWVSITKWSITSPRNLLLHTWVTASAALTGFGMGVVLGLILAVCIVHSKTLDKALLPWIVASQTVPVLAIAPIVLVILGSLGITGLMPKAVIAMYLCFSQSRSRWCKVYAPHRNWKWSCCIRMAPAKLIRFGYYACRHHYRFYSQLSGWRLPVDWSVRLSLNSRLARRLVWVLDY